MNITVAETKKIRVVIDSTLSLDFREDELMSLKPMAVKPGDFGDPAQVALCSISPRELAGSPRMVSFFCSLSESCIRVQVWHLFIVSTVITLLCLNQLIKSWLKVRVLLL